MSNLMVSSITSTKNENFKRSWIEAHQYLDKDHSFDQIIESIANLEKSNLLFNEMVIVHCMVEFKPLFVTKNIERILGYRQEEILGLESQAYFKLHALDQPDFWVNLMKWENEAKRNIPDIETYQKGHGYYAGISQMCKDGSLKRFLVRHKTVFGENFEVPRFYILYFEDITHFYKGSEYWMLFQNFTDRGMYSSFYKKSGVDNNIITEREKEVLKLIVAGKTTKEVAQMLHISPATVSQHRKNMIKRTHAKDTSALIHFCKICGII